MSTKDKKSNDVNKNKLGTAITVANLPGLVFDTNGNLDMTASQEALVSSRPVPVARDYKVIVEPKAVDSADIQQLMNDDLAEATLSGDGWAPIL